MKLTIKSLKNMKSQNFIKLNEILRFYNGFDELVEYTYERLQMGLMNTLENYNDIMKKPQYVKYIK